MLFIQLTLPLTISKAIIQLNMSCTNRLLDVQSFLFAYEAKHGNITNAISFPWRLANFSQTKVYWSMLCRATMGWYAQKCPLWKEISEVVAFLCTRKSRFVSLCVEREREICTGGASLWTHLHGDESCSTFVISVLFIIIYLSMFFRKVGRGHSLNRIFPHPRTM